MRSKLDFVDDKHPEQKKTKKVKKEKTVDKFTDLLRNSSIEVLRHSKIPKVEQMIADKIGMEELKNISNHGFLKRAENIITNDLHNSDPYCKNF